MSEPKGEIGNNYIFKYLKNLVLENINSFFSNMVTINKFINKDFNKNSLSSELELNREYIIIKGGILLSSYKEDKLKVIINPTLVNNNDMTLSYILFLDFSMQLQKVFSDKCNLEVDKSHMIIDIDSESEALFFLNIYINKSFEMFNKHGGFSLNNSKSMNIDINSVEYMKNSLIAQQYLRIVKGWSLLPRGIIATVDDKYGDIPSLTTQYGDILINEYPELLEVETMVNKITILDFEDNCLPEEIEYMNLFFTKGFKVVDGNLNIYPYSWIKSNDIRKYGTRNNETSILKLLKYRKLCTINNQYTAENKRDIEEINRRGLEIKRAWSEPYQKEMEDNDSE